MAIYHVSCINIQTTGKNQEAIYKKLVENMPHNHIPKKAIQRALFVLQDPFSEDIKDAYSTIAYFHSNVNYPGRMRFEREKDRIWSEKDIKDKLKKNTKLEQSLDIEKQENGTYSITFKYSPETEIPRKINECEKYKEVLSLEEFFLRKGAFKKTNKKRTQIIKKNN